MSNSYDQEAALSSALQRMVKTIMRGSVIVDGVITGVDESAFTCDVKVGNEENSSTYFDVPLRILVSDQSSMVEIPEMNTHCLLTFRDGNTGSPQILSIHKALKILVICDQVIFNDGALGGLLKLNESVNRWNKIEQDLNILKAAFNSWVVSPGDGGGALKSAAGAWASQLLTPTTAADVENPKIKQ